jgi:hypothetical protein
LRPKRREDGRKKPKKNEDGRKKPKKNKDGRKKPGKPKELSDRGISPEIVEEHRNEEGEEDIIILTSNIFCFSTNNVVLDGNAA